MSRRFGKLFGGKSGAVRGGVGAPERIDPSFPDVERVTVPDDENTPGERMNSENHTDSQSDADPAGNASTDQVDQHIDEAATEATGDVMGDAEGDPGDDVINDAGAHDGLAEEGGDPQNDRILELEDQMLRAKAEIQNMQRRSREELSKARKYGSENLAVALLDVHDNLERTVAAADGTSGADALVEGVRLTLKQLDDAFAKHNVVEVASEIGIKLDPSVHSAMSTQPTNDVPPNHVAAVIQKGYTLHDRLLRPAMVMVAAPLPDEAPRAAESAADTDSPSEA